MANAGVGDLGVPPDGPLGVDLDSELPPRRGGRKKQSVLQDLLNKHTEVVTDLQADKRWRK